MTHIPRRQYLGLLSAGAGLTVVSGARAGAGQDDDTDESDDDEDDSPEKIDDWQYEPSRGREMHSGQHNLAATAQSTQSVGLSVGGAADIKTFRRNVSEGYLPLPESMAPEGLYHDYYFETDGGEQCQSLFCPRYRSAVSADPLSGEREHFLSVGLDSGLAQSDFERPPLNLVLVLDISGSMGGEFDEYYYDRFGNEQQVEEPTEQPKIDIAADVLATLTEQLRPEDRLGIVLFNSTSHVAKPLRPVERTDMEAIRGHIREDIVAGGGTNVSQGLDEAAGLYDDRANSEYEHRTILLTDAQPNHGTTDADSFQSTLQSRAADGLHTSVVGIGVDFNAELIDEITAVRGANYYSVHSASQFSQRMVGGFEYMVTPLVYDLSLELDAEGYDIDHVYGSTAAEAATGELLSVNTLFPSRSRDGKAEGGVVLVKLARTGADEATELELRASWERRDGTTGSTTEQLTIEQTPHWDGTAIRKAVLLARYADLLTHWTVSERDIPMAAAYPAETDGGQQGSYWLRKRLSAVDFSSEWFDSLPGAERLEQLDSEPEDPELPGIEPPSGDLSKWELQSAPLTVSAENADRLEQFREHFAAEMTAIDDESLQQELALLETILDAA